MNTKIVIYQPLWPFTGATLGLSLDAAGVTVKFDSPVLIPWDKVLDVTWLAQTFRGVRVFEFEALCKGLGEAWKLKDMLPAPEPTAAAALNQEAADTAEYLKRATPRLARLDELAPLCAFDKLPGQRTEAEQAAWDEHERLLREQLADEAAQGM